MAESCNDENVGYYHVKITGYGDSDYYQMLFAGNEEIQYNAICNLWSLLDADALSVDSLKGTSRYKKAVKIYEKIYSMKDSKNTWIGSAAIRYVGRLEYNRPALTRYLLANTNPSVNIQLATWSAWTSIKDDAAADSSLLIQKTNFCRSQPSWLIRQCAYDYITKATAPHFESNLMKTYDTCSEKYQKLEILQVLNLHVCDTVFDFLKRHYITAADSVIQQQILLSLTNAMDAKQALHWFEQHPKETTQLLNNGFELAGGHADFYCRLIQAALKQGWNPAEKEYFTDNNQHYPLLYYYILEDKYHFETTDSVKPVQSAALKKIEQQLLADKKLAPAWLEYENAHLRYSLPGDLVKAQQQLTADYTAEVKALFSKYQMDSSVIRDFLVQLQNASNSLYRIKYVKDKTGRK